MPIKLLPNRSHPFPRFRLAASAIQPRVRIVNYALSCDWLKQNNDLRQLPPINSARAHYAIQDLVAVPLGPIHSTRAIGLTDHVRIAYVELSRNRPVLIG